MEVGPVELGEAPNLVQEMRRIGQTFSEAYNYMRRHQLKFGYGPNYLSLEVVVRPDEPGTALITRPNAASDLFNTDITRPNAASDLFNTDITRPNAASDLSNTNITRPNAASDLINTDITRPNAASDLINTTNTFKVKQLTPIPNEVRELTLMGNEVTKQTPLYTGDTHGPRGDHCPSALLILGTTQYDDGLSGKCSDVEGKFRSPNADTVPITNSHTSDTASNSYRSLIADTAFNTNNTPTNGLSTYKPKTLSLAQSLILDTDYSKSHQVNSIQFTLACFVLTVHPQRTRRRFNLCKNTCTKLNKSSVFVNIGPSQRRKLFSFIIKN